MSIFFKFFEMFMVAAVKCYIEHPYDLIPTWFRASFYWLSFYLHIGSTLLLFCCLDENSTYCSDWTLVFFWGLLGFYYNKQLNCLESNCKFCFPCDKEQLISVFCSYIFLLIFGTSWVSPMPIRFGSWLSILVEIDILSLWLSFLGFSWVVAILPTLDSTLTFQAFCHPSWMQLVKNIKFTDLAPCYSFKIFLSCP